MTLQLLPLEQSEYGILTKIAWEVFSDNIFKPMFPGGVTPEIKTFQIEEGLKEWREDPEKYRLMKIIDTTLPADDEYGRILSVAKWKVFPRDRTDEEMEADRKKAESELTKLPPGANESFIMQFFGKSAELREKIVGNKAHYYLEVLATRPLHHRRGAGAMHLKWGLDQADKIGAAAYLESSEMGNPLYKKFGFENVMPFPEFARDCGVDMDLHGMCMFRPARPLK